jgi:RNA polymerase sigma factor (sigma-70 family)
MTLSLAASEDSAIIELALAGQTEGFIVLMDRHLAAVKARIDSMVLNPTPSCRRERRRPLCQGLDDFDAFISARESPLQSLSRAETTQVVRKAVVELPAIYRQVLIFREFEQLSAREIARSLHLSIPAVKTRLFRARFMLVAALHRQK